MDRPQLGRGRHARRAAGRATRKERHAKVREKGKKDVFSGERLEGYLLCPPGGSSSRVAAIAALGYRHRRENGVRARVAARGGARVETQLVAACGRRTQLIQLIYLRYLCVGAEREERMDVCFLLTLYI